MLEADPSELEGSADTPLAAHLRGCERCRAVAARLLEGQAVISDAIAGMRPAVGARAPVRRTAAPPRSRSVPRARWLVPIAIAAALAALILVNRTERLPDPGPAAGPGTGPVERASPAVTVEAPAGRDILVFETEDPTITVVWLF